MNGVSRVFIIFHTKKKSIKTRARHHRLSMKISYFFRIFNFTSKICLFFYFFIMQKNVVNLITATPISLIYYTCFFHFFLLLFPLLYTNNRLFLILNCFICLSSSIYSYDVPIAILYGVINSIIFRFGCFSKW